jgi:Dyp-type peroxidase family
VPPEAKLRAAAPLVAAGAAPYQGNIVTPHPRVYCARAFFVEFPREARGPDAEIARAWLEKLRHFENVTIGFTLAGLRALGAPEAELEELPAAFREGMRARATLLGDPDGPFPLPGARRDHDSLHAVVIAYRFEAPQSEAAIVQTLHDLGGQVRSAGTPALTNSDLALELAEALDENLRELQQVLGGEGARVLATQDLHHPLIAEKNIEYFGFRDGIRQAVQLDAAGRVLDPTSVRQVILRADQPLLRDGSFLVMRQLEQHVDTFWDRMSQVSDTLGLGGAQRAAELAMGRQMDGKPLGGGAEYDPAFSPDDAGKVCPFHAHTRRVNLQIEPQAELNPQLVRRSMSYVSGDKQRGLMFMAFNADLATQFEFIQRNWVQSGSHVGQTSDERDAVVGLQHAESAAKPPRAHDASGFAKDGQFVLVDLPAFVSLRWGEYFLVPGRKALELLASGALGSPRQHEPGVLDYAARLPALAALRSEDAKALVRTWLDGPETATQFWHQVETGRSPVRLDDWVFVAQPEQVRAIMSDASGRYSVAGYAERMRTTSGKFLLGMDKPEYDGEHAALAILPRGAQVAPIERVAHQATHEFARLMQQSAHIGSLTGGPAGVAEIDLQALMAFVLNAVWAETFGLAGPSAGSLLQWGADITRWLFRVAATPADHAKAAEAGYDFRQHVVSLLASLDDAALRAELEAASAATSSKTGAAHERILNAARPQPGESVGQRRERALRATACELCRLLGASSATDDAVVRNLLNIVTGSLGATARLFLDGFELFRRARAAAGEQLSPPAAASTALGREPSAGDSLYEMVLMRGLGEVKRGAPDSLYRVYRGEGEALPALAALESELKPGDTVVLWLGGMLQLGGDEWHVRGHDYAFGAGFRTCPGMDMGKALLNGLLIGLFELRGLSAHKPGFVQFSTEQPLPEARG